MPNDTSLHLEQARRDPPAVSPGVYEIWRRETLTYVLLRSVLHSYVRRARWSRTTGAVCPTHNDHLVPCECILYCTYIPEPLLITIGGAPDRARRVVRAPG